MANKKIYSVVICSFNKLKTLQIVANKLKKLRPENELILTDDRSTDGTIEWAANSGLFSKIHVEDTQGNFRLNTIRNKGVELASNEYVVILDADCVPNDSYFDGYDELFELYPQSAGAGITDRYDSKGIKIIENDTRWDLYNEEPIKETTWENFYGGNIAFPKSIWQTTKFDEDYNGYWGFEDLDFAAMLSYKKVKLYLSFLSSARHLGHPKCKESVIAHNENGRNINFFEKKHGGKFYANMKNFTNNKTFNKKKILISKNAKILRNGQRNPKDYPYWDSLIHLFAEHDVTILDKEVPLPELDKMILGCDFFISTDSFFQHYAWSLNKKGVVIFSVTNPAIFGHSLHLNILKDPKYLMGNQFLFMESQPYNAEAFESPQKIFDLIKQNF